MIGDRRSGEIESLWHVNGVFTNVAIRGAIDNRDDVVLAGKGMRISKYLDLTRGTSDVTSSHRPIRHLQRAIDNRETLTQLVFGNRQRRIREEVVPPHERIQAFLAEEPAEFGHLG